MPHKSFILVSRLTHCIRNWPCTLFVDLKLDNVLFCDGTDPESIQKLLSDSPLISGGEFELHGMRYPMICSQPVPHPFSWNDPPMCVELYSVQLTDLGHSIQSLFFFAINPRLTWCCSTVDGQRTPDLNDQSICLTSSRSHTWGKLWWQSRHLVAWLRGQYLSASLANPLFTCYRFSSSSLAAGSLVPKGVVKRGALKMITWPRWST